MKISVYNSQKDLKISTRKIKAIVSLALRFHRVLCDEIAIHFISDRKMRALHGTYFNDPSPTDCISFPYAEDPANYFLGEVFVCPKTALRYAKTHGGDPERELILYLIHGVLHLLGYDDMNSKDKRIMRAKEKELMTYLDSHLR